MKNDDSRIYFLLSNFLNKWSLYCSYSICFYYAYDFTQDSAGPDKISRALYSDDDEEEEEEERDNENENKEKEEGKEALGVSVIGGGGKGEEEGAYGELYLFDVICVGLVVFARAIFDCNAFCHDICRCWYVAIDNLLKV